MYCKLHIHSSSIESVVSILESKYGASRKERSNYYFEQFEICIFRNKEYAANKLCTYPDGFLYYGIIAEAEIYKEHIQITASILRSLWHNNMPTVVSSDYEKELNEYIFSI